MSGTEGQSVRSELPVVYADTAQKVFSSRTFSGVELSEDFKANAKPIGQIYDILIRYMTGTHKGETYYPNTEESYREYQILRRAVSDKTPLLSGEEFERLLHIMATQVPPFIHILREVGFDAKSSGLVAASKYVCPTEAQPDKADIAFRSLLHINLLTIKELVGKKELRSNWGVRPIPAKLEEFNIREGRADFVLRCLFFQERYFEHILPADAARFRAINETTNKKIFRPLLESCVKEQLIKSFNCSDLRSSYPGITNRLNDVFLFHIPEEIQARYAYLCSVLDSDVVGALLSKDYKESQNQKRRSGDISETQYFSELAGHLLQNPILSAKPSIPEISAEVIKLGQWQLAYEKQRQVDREVNEVKALSDSVLKQGTFFRVKHGKKLYAKDKYIKLGLAGKIPSILGCTVPFDVIGEVADVDLDDYDQVIFLFKDRKVMAKAVETAIEIFEKTEDPFYLYILEHLFKISGLSEEDLKKLASPVFYGKYKEALRQTYMGLLPWYKRLWLVITSSEIKDTDIAQLRAERERANAAKLTRKRDALQRQSRVEAKRKVHDLALKRLEGADETEVPTESPAQAVSQDILDSIKSQIDRAWDMNQYPTKNSLLDKAPASEKAEWVKTLGLIDAGAQSVKSVVRIPVRHFDAVYGCRDYLLERKESLLDRMNKKTSGNEEFLLNSTTVMSLKVSEQEKETALAITSFLQRLN